MRTPKRTFTFLGCVCLGAASVLGTLRALRHFASPLEGAQAITSTTTWQSGSNPNGFAMYYWSGRDDIHYVSKGTDGTPHLFRRSAHAQENVPGTEGPAISLRNGRYPGQLSPDGKWFVEWHRNKLRQNIPTFVSVAGGQRRDGEATWGMEGVWTPDSAAMVSEVWRFGVVTVDRYDPSSGLRQTAAIPGLKPFNSPQRIDASGHLVGFADSAYILNLGKTAGLRSLNYPRTKMVRADLAHPKNKPEEWTVAAPENLDNIGRCLLAPTCDRILWVVRGDTTPLFLRKLRGYVPGLSAASGMGNRWLVSGLHGENMHEVASYRYLRIQTKNGALPPIPDPYSSPRWMPDGRHISFIFKNTLYTRPVD